MIHRRGTSPSAEAAMTTIRSLRRANAAEPWRDPSHHVSQPPQAHTRACRQFATRGLYWPVAAEPADFRETG
jgi:hypothetical protein